MKPLENANVAGDESNRNVIDTLHQMELRMSERLVRVETELREWRKESERLRVADEKISAEVHELRNEFEVEKQIGRDRANRLIISMAVVALIALGDLFVRSLPLLT
jgi:hypothetical protein